MAKRKGNIKAISNQWPSDAEADVQIGIMSSMEQHSIAVAIVGAAMLEFALERILRAKFKRNDDTSWERLVGPEGGLNAFASKINLGYAFAVYDDSTRAALMSVKTIRNVFAHAKKPVDFNHERIAAELAEIKTGMGSPTILIKAVKDFKRHQTPPKAKFIILCLSISVLLSRRHTAQIKAKTAHWKRKAIAKAKKETMAGAFGRLAGLGNLASLVGTPAFDPKALTLAQAILASPPAIEVDSE